MLADIELSRIVRKFSEWPVRWIRQYGTVVFCVIACIQNLGIGWTVFLAPTSFQRNSSYDPLRQTLPLGVWGLILIVLGFLLLYGLLTRTEAVLRFGLTLTVVVLLIWSGGFLLAWHRGQLSSPAAPFIYGALAFKDLIVLAFPLRVRTAEEMRLWGI